MFKTGDKVRVKENLKEVILEREKNGQDTIENDRMIERYHGKVGVIKRTDGSSYVLFGYYWNEYSLEHVVINSISGYDLLL